MSDTLFTSKAWKSLLDTIPQGLVAVDESGRVVYLNPFAETALGIRAREALHLHFGDVFCPSLPMDQCWINQALEARVPVRRHKFMMDRNDGHCHMLEADFTPVSDKSGELLGAIVAVEESSTSQLLAARLKQAEEAREAILGSIADGLFTVDHEWRITSFNRAAERIVGFKESDVLGKLCTQVLQTDQCRNGCPLASTLERNENLFDHEVTFRSRHGEPKRVTVNTAVLYNGGGAPIWGVVSFRDTSMLTQLQDDLKSTTHFEGMVGKHRKILDTYELIAEVADSDATVLIMGESGTGKEMVANALVRRSHRRDSAFVKVNCSVFPETLLESELFGHVKGAFTDAGNDRVGRFELADGGTIFLDEIGDMSPAAQVKLLRVLEERQFERVGSSETIKVDVRIIAATNQDLPELVRKKRFRGDLFYRLNVIPINLPPLRERMSDLPLLLDYFMAKYRLLTGKPVKQISDAALDLLLSHDYPGNVRELENVIEHAFARNSGSVLTEQKLPLALRHQAAAGPTVKCPDEGGGECERIVNALRRAHWNRNEAARMLGLSRTTLWRRVKALGILDEVDAG